MNRILTIAICRQPEYCMKSFHPVAKMKHYPRVIDCDAAEPVLFSAVFRQNSGSGLCGICLQR